MKIVPILAITNALALALAVFLYVQLGELKSQVSSRRSDVVRPDPNAAALEMRIAELERANASRGHEPMAAPDALAPEAPAAPGGAASRGGSDAPPLASPAAEEGTGSASTGETEEYNPQEMQSFRKKVKKAIELNDEEEQKSRIVERIDALVKDNKIAPLNQHQKDGVATTVLAYRKKLPEVWRKLRENGTFENVSNEDRGRIIRSEYDALRADAQRSLEEFMPAADAKTYLDSTLRETMRFGAGAGGFGGRDGPPAPPAPGR